MCLFRCSKLLVNKESFKIQDLMKKSNKTDGGTAFQASQKCLDVDKKLKMVVVETTR